MEYVKIKHTIKPSLQSIALDGSKVNDYSPQGVIIWYYWGVDYVLLASELCYDAKMKCMWEPRSLGVLFSSVGRQSHSGCQPRSKRVRRIHMDNCSVPTQGRDHLYKPLLATIIALLGLPLHIRTGSSWRYLMYTRTDCNAESAEDFRSERIIQPTGL